LSTYLSSCIFCSNQGALIDKLEAGSDGRVSSAVLEDGSVVEADTVTTFFFFFFFFFCANILFHHLNYLLLRMKVCYQKLP
jgi:hypothetical protein